ncbi:DUF4625 domain-containing protein [Sphingobacterium mizutaii]|uniref:DUF4625 domain-containing protein n=1 Tax=Sphingobacterium mizutaii TaxID=1010 RepID=UPI0016259C95
MRTKFSDNTELGTYYLDIHQIFDHHSHSKDLKEFNLKPKIGSLKSLSVYPVIRFQHERKVTRPCRR